MYVYFFMDSICVLENVEICIVFLRRIVDIFVFKFLMGFRVFIKCLFGYWELIFYELMRIIIF